jgi:cyclic pyranopterin phosphate synthase
MGHNIAWSRLDSVRLKVTDLCPWNCWWCHNEGTGDRNSRSIGSVNWDKDTELTLTKLVKELEIVEVHLTGGEPTSHPRLSSIVEGLRRLGLTVKATTIGCPEDILRKLIDSGLHDFNFSLHGLSASSLLSTQIDRSLKWAERQLVQQLDAINLARELGARIKINTVLADEEDFDRVTAVIQWAQTKHIPVRVMNELGNGDASSQAVLRLLNQLGAIELRRQYTTGSSSYKAVYALPSGYEISYKGIRDYYLERSMCGRCDLKGRGLCTEKFYGIRLEKRRSGTSWQLYVRLCIHRTDATVLLPVDEFLRSNQLAEIKEQLARQNCDAMPKVSLGLPLLSRQIPDLVLKQEVSHVVPATSA